MGDNDAPLCYHALKISNRVLVGIGCLIWGEFFSVLVDQMKVIHQSSNVDHDQRISLAHIGPERASDKPDPVNFHSVVLKKVKIWNLFAPSSILKELLGYVTMIVLMISSNQDEILIAVIRTPPSESVKMPIADADVSS